MRIEKENYLEILDAAARLAEYGFAVFRWESGERYPRYEWVNDAVVARTKVDRDELLGGTPTFLMLGDNVRLVDVARSRAESADPSPFEIELVNQDGSAYWIECVVQPLAPAPNGALRFVCATHVIDRRKEHEHFARLLSATIDNEPDGVFIVRLRGQNPLSPPVVYANPAFFRMTGYTADNLASGIYPRLFGEGTDRVLIGARAEALLRGEPVVGEVQLYRKDGSSFWADMSAHPLESPIIHCAITIHDTTERRAAQDAMSLLSEGIAQASDFIVVSDDTPLDQGGPKILYVNRSFLDATGYREDELTGQPYAVLFSPNNPPSLMESIRGEIQERRTNEREALVAGKDGGEFWIEFVDRPFTTRHGRHLRLLVGRDISARRRSSNQLSLLFAATEQASTPIVIYEPDAAGGLSISYENEAASKRGHYHLLSLWGGHDEDARNVRTQLERGEMVIATYAASGDDGPELIQMSARPVRNESRLEAILTQERVLSAHAANAERSAHSRLVNLAVMLPAVERATDAGERLEALRALLRRTFEASLVIGDTDAYGPVRIDERARSATFAYRGRAARVTWAYTMDSLALTALRFSIEAALDAR
ncbi:MAG TPA: PAS domain-containing protein [Candidatus Baltobacteraceae bacterium]|nr:PAS domain-containing protein [Candidatus Baltobacteraceae bacterium]